MTVRSCLGLLALAASLRADPPLIPGRDLTLLLPAGETRAAVVILEGGQFLELTVHQTDQIVGVRIVAPDGRALVAMRWSDRRRWRKPASFVAPVSGTYRVLLSTDARVATTCRLESGEPRSPTQNDRLRLEAERLHREASALRRPDATAEARRQALATFEGALALWTRLEVPVFESAALIEIGSLREDLGEYGPALEAITAAEAAALRVPDRELEAHALHIAGAVHYHLGHSEAAREHTERALALRRTLGDREGQAEGLSNLSVFASDVGEQRRGLELAQEQLALWRAIGDRERVGDALGIVGHALLQLGELQPALDAVTERLAVAREFRDRSGEAYALYNLGAIDWQLGDMTTAIERFTGALPICREQGDVRLELAALNSIGMVYDKSGDVPRAREAMQQVLARRIQAGDSNGAATSRLNLAALELDAKRLDEAEAHVRQALETVDEVGDRSRQAQALDYLGTILAQKGRHEEGRAHLLKALELRGIVSDPVMEAGTLVSLARVLRDMGELAEARARLEEAEARYESVRSAVRSGTLRATFVASVRRALELYVDVLVRLHEREPQAGHGVRAFEASERARGRSLLEQIVESRAEIRTGVDAALLGRERAVGERLAWALDRQMRASAGGERAVEATRELKALGDEYEQVQSQIRMASPRYAALTQPEPLTLADIQTRILGPDTLLLEYLIGKERSFLWTVTAEDVEVHVLPGRDELEAAARAAQKALARREPREGDDAALIAFSRMLLEPAAKRLRDRRLLVVGDGVVDYVPLGGLPDPRAPDRPIVARHEVVALPSASLLDVLRQPRAVAPAPRLLAVLADPVFDRHDSRLPRSRTGSRETPPAPYPRLALATRDFVDGPLPRLAFSRREAQALASLVPARERRLALDFDASRATATSEELRQYRFLHFATHGFLNGQRPELSGLVLSLVDAAGRDQQGFLAAPDVLNLELNADLVVLSGCGTALGREIRGEGLMGLARAFMYAGTPRVVASLWRVDDAATAKLMQDFYTGMLRHERTPAAALRAAQLALARERPRPYFWAAFQLQGEWR